MPAEDAKDTALAFGDHKIGESTTAGHGPPLTHSDIPAGAVKLPPSCGAAARASSRRRAALKQLRSLPLRAKQREIAREKAWSTSDKRSGHKSFLPWGDGIPHITAQHRRFAFHIPSFPCQNHSVLPVERFYFNSMRTWPKGRTLVQGGGQEAHGRQLDVDRVAACSLWPSASSIVPRACQIT